MTFLDELNAIGERIRENSRKTINVQGSGGKLAVRFRPPPDRDALTDVVATYRVGGALSRDQELQLLVDCCDEVLHRNGGGALERIPMDDGTDGGPLHFDAGDPRWRGECKTARDCVARLYHLDDIPLAAAGVADTLVDWLQGIDTEIAARAEGESVGGPSS